MDEVRAAGEGAIETLLRQAMSCALHYGHGSVGAEHLLYVIAGTEEGRRALEVMRLDADAMRTHLAQAFTLDAALVEGGHEVPIDFAPSVGMSVDEPVRIARSRRRPVRVGDLLRRMRTMVGEARETCPAVLREAFVLAGLQGAPEVGQSAHAAARPNSTVSGEGGGVYDLTPDFSEIWDFDEESHGPGGAGGDGHASDDLDDEAMIEAMAREMDEAEADYLYIQEDSESDAISGDTEDDDAAAAVRRVLRDMTDEAREGRLDAVIGRDALIGRIGEVICRRRKRNVILSGQAGVGKTALVEGLAQAVVAGRVAGIAPQTTIYEARVGELVAGTRLRGEFEARIAKLIEIVREAGAILFVDEIHTLMGAGTAGSGGLDAANMLKPALARGDICLIGATTPAEMRPLRRDAAMLRRFEVVEVAAPSAAETREILDLAIGDYALHHEVMVGPGALDTVIDVAARYLPHKTFPDKAFDIVDTACVIARQRGSAEVAKADIFSALARMPGQSGPRRGAVPAGLDSLEERLGARIHGQTAAVAEMARMARAAELGLGQSGPAVSALLTGPTGTGKSQAVQHYADVLDLPIVTVALSEYTEAHSVARLIGAPPGYVGFDAGGILTEACEAHGRFVLLLDEIDKAHEDIFDVLMQMLDRGVLRTGDGREVSCAGAHVFMGANLGAEVPSGAQLGFGRTPDPEAVTGAAIRARFRPEFVGRIGSIIRFTSLETGALAAIARDRATDLTRRMADGGRSVRFAPDWDRAFAARFAGAAGGARALISAFRSEVVDAVGRAVLAAPEAAVVVAADAEGRVRVDNEDDPGTDIA